MPEGSQANFELIKANLTVIIINGKECYGERPGGLPCPNTDLPIEFAAVYDGEGNEIDVDGYVIARPVIVKTNDNTYYETIGPENPYR